MPFQTDYPMASLLPDAAPVVSAGDPIYFPASRDALPVHRFPFYEGECCSLIRRRDGDLTAAELGWSSDHPIARRYWYGTWP
jgi:hypothetical protein